MKNGSYIFIAVIFSLFTSLIDISHVSAEDNPAQIQINSTNHSNYVFERVCILDSWWILVFDGVQLVDIYPE